MDVACGSRVSIESTSTLGDCHESLTVFSDRVRVCVFPNLGILPTVLPGPACVTNADVPLASVRVEDWGWQRDMAKGRGDRDRSTWSLTLSYCSQRHAEKPSPFQIRADRPTGLQADAEFQTFQSRSEQ